MSADRPPERRNPERRAAEPTNPAGPIRRRQPPEQPVQPLAWSAVPPESPVADRPRQPTPARATPARPTQPGPSWAPTQQPQPIPPDPQPRRVRSGAGGDGYSPRRGVAREALATRDARDPARARVPAARPAHNPPESRPPRPPRQRRRWLRRSVRAIPVLVVLLVVAVVGAGLYLDTKLHRVDALTSYADRVADTPGTNWLLVGSDSRQGLSAAQQQELATGGDLGNGRTDTIMLAHIPAGGGAATLISVPRDLYVTIPGQGDYKINAAFTLGGAPLLAQTIETRTGVHIDHYAEIGFGGFADVVDSLGGVQMCLDYPLNDPKAGLRLAAGCQKLSGAQALGYVRTRATPRADLDRVVHQRQFLAALAQKAGSPTTLINPWRLWAMTSGVVDSLTVDNSTHIWDLARLAWSLRGNIVTVTTPTGGDEYTSDGDALVWNDETTRFFRQVAADQPVT